MIKNETYETIDGASTLIGYTLIQRIDGSIVVTEWNGETIERAPTEDEIYQLEFWESSNE